MWFLWAVPLLVVVYGTIRDPIERPRRRSPFVVVPLLGVAMLAPAMISCGPPKPYEAFQTLYTMTPSELQQQCGSPSQFNTDVLVKDDGIVDLHYRNGDTGDGAFEVVVRFTRASNGDFDSLGAWRGVRTPHDLGFPIDGAEAMRLMSCLHATPSMAGSRFREIGTGAPFVVASTTLRMAQVDVRGTSPREGITGLPQGVNGGLGSQLGSGIGSGLGSGLGTGSGGGGRGPDDEPQQPSIVVPCPTDSDTCKLLDSIEFRAQLRQVLTAAESNNYKEVNDWLNGVTGRNIVVIQLPDLLVDRQAAVKEIFRLQINLDNAVTARLRADVARLTPFKWDSSEEKQRKLESVMHDDGERVQTWKAAAEEARPSKSMTSASVTERAESSSHESHVRFNSEAYREAIQVDITKSWGSH